MNPHEWRDAVHRLRRLLETDCHNMENVSRGDGDRDTYRDYPRCTLPESHRSDVGRKELSPSSHRGYSEVPEVGDPDGHPLEEADLDAELARKKKTLREIEERIMHKKASIAMKAVSSTPPGVSGNKHLARCEGGTLRDRVNQILRQRQHLSKVQSTRERKNPSRLSSGGELQEQHPLKLRVQALMKRRHRVLHFNSKEVPDGPQSPPGRSVASPANREAVINKGFECFLSMLNKGVDISLLRPEDECHEDADVSQPRPGRSISSPAKEENNISKGFERFLNVLNKGVDMEKFSRIMSNDRDDIPLGEESLSTQLPDVESDPSFRSERQWTNSEVSLLDLSQAGEEQISNNKPIVRSLSQSSESISGASVCSRASDSEQPYSRVLLTGHNHVNKSQLLPALSPPSKNQRSDTRTIPPTRESESQRAKSAASRKSISKTTKSLSSGASRSAPGKASEQTSSRASQPGRGPPTENKRSNTKTIPPTRASESQRAKSGASQKSISKTTKSLSSGASRSAPGKASEQTSSRASQPGRGPPTENKRSNARLAEPSLSRAKETKRLKSGAPPTGLKQASKNQQSNKGLKGRGEASKSQRLKGGTFIPGLGESRESNDGSQPGSLSQAKQTEDPPRRPHGHLKRGASLAGHSRTKTAEAKINSPPGERPRSERLSLPDDQEKKKDGETCSLGSSGQSESNMAVKKKKKEEEERQENPPVNEQHEQLQNILKTLGWNLDVEELSKLASRTQERLYGKKKEAAGSTKEQESQPKHSHGGDPGKSSSSRSPLRSSKAEHSQEIMCGRRREGWRSDGRRREGWRSDGWRSDGRRSEGEGRRSEGEGRRSEGEGSDGWRSEVEGSDGWRSDGWRSDGRRSEGRRNEGRRSEGEGSDGWRSDGWRSDGWRSDGRRSEGRRNEGEGSEGRRSEGWRSEGWRSDGRRNEGWRSEGEGSDGWRSEGRRSEGRRRPESRGKEALRQRRSLRDHRKSPSFSSSSSFSYSSSSFSSSSSSASSPSPSRLRRSRSRDLKPKREVGSGERTIERLNPSVRRDSREAQGDQKDPEHFPAYPYPQNQAFPQPAASAFPDYSLPQYSHFSHSGPYSGATDPYWTYNQYNVPPPPLPASGHPCPQFSGSAVPPDVDYADPSFHAGSDLFPNPDLYSGPRTRCLTVINTMQGSSQGLTGGHNLNHGSKEPTRHFSKPVNIVQNHNNTPKSPAVPEKPTVHTQPGDRRPNAKRLRKRKRQPTEEEIKANLRKKLEVFNQKAKNTSQLPPSELPQSANSLISEME